MSAERAMHINAVPGIVLVIIICNMVKESLQQHWWAYTFNCIQLSVVYVVVDWFICKIWVHKDILWNVCMLLIHQQWSHSDNHSHTWNHKHWVHLQRNNNQYHARERRISQWCLMQTASSFRHSLYIFWISFSLFSFLKFSYYDHFDLKYSFIILLSLAFRYCK